MGPRERTATYAVAAALLLIGGLAAAAAALGRTDLGEIHGQLAVSLLVGLLCGGTFLAGFCVLEQGLLSPYGWPAAAIAPPALALFLVGVWAESVWRGEEETFGKGVLTALALVITALVVASTRLLAGRAALPVAVVAFAFDALALGAIWSTSADEVVEDRASVELALRWLDALFALLVAGFLAAPLAARAVNLARNRFTD
jgi:hypothetical protein